MTDLVVREASGDDLEGLLRLYSHLHPDEPAIEPAMADRIWAELLATEWTTVLVAELEGALVSTCTLTLVPNLTRGGRPYGLIENVVTDPGHQRRGFGRAVLAEAAAVAGSHDAYKMMLATGSRRESTLAFYESAGFTRNGRTFFEIRRL